MARPDNFIADDMLELATNADELSTHTAKWLYRARFQKQLGKAWRQLRAPPPWQAVAQKSWARLTATHRPLTPLRNKLRRPSDGSNDKRWRTLEAGPRKQLRAALNTPVPRRLILNFTCKTGSLASALEGGTPSEQNFRKSLTVWLPVLISKIPSAPFRDNTV